MKRGEVWSVAGGADSITICLFTTDSTEAPLFHIRVDATVENGLRETSALMVDEPSAVPREKLGARIGRLEARDLVTLNQAILVFLGLARAQRTG